MNVKEPQPIPSAAARRNRDGLVMAICVFWVVASLIGFTVQAFAATPTGLRGSQSPPIPAAKTRPSIAKAKAKVQPAMPNTPQAWLGASIWRAGPCDTAQNFQAFSFTGAPKVEVGSGKPGDGERLELLRILTDPTGLIQVETRVCAPVGCNQTIERYKKLSDNQMQEWHFEGRLPNVTPYVIVANGAAVDGSGPGRVFNRCGA
jgi:hypothetical protein